MKDIIPTRVDGHLLDDLLGLESSKMGYYSEVKQKIQELEAANLGLHTKKKELQAVFDAITDGVIIYDHQGHVQYRNHVCLKLFPTETLIGTSFKGLFGDEFGVSSSDCSVEKAINGESCQFSFAIVQSEQRHKGYYDAVATPIPDQAENPNSGNRALVLIRDVTDRRLRELQLVQAERCPVSVSWPPASPTNSTTRSPR